MLSITNNRLQQLFTSLVILFFFALSIQISHAEEATAKKETTAKKELTAKQIVDLSSKLNDLPYEAELMKMTIVDAGGYKTERELRMYNREFDKGLYRYLMVFDSPSGIKGTGLLTWQNANGSDDQWLYLPGIGKVKRIARSEKGSYFMGTDYTYEDLSRSERRQQRYTKLSDTKINGISVYVIKDQSNMNTRSLNEAAYKLLYITKKNFVILKTNYYNRSGKLLKSQEFSNFKKIKGTTAWRPSTIVMKNYQEGSQTIMQVLKRNFSGKAAPISYFTKRHLTNQ